MPAKPTSKLSKATSKPTSTPTSSSEPDVKALKLKAQRNQGLVMVAIALSGIAYASYKHPDFQPAGKLGPIASAALPGVLGSFAFLILGHLVSQLFSR